MTCAPKKISTDILQKLAGDYLLADQTVTFAVTGSVLHLPVPGQPIYELIPRKQLSFDVQGLAGFSVDFLMDPSGKVHQPNGVLHPKRK